MGVVGVYGVLFFSIVCLASSSVSFYWVFLELASLCLVPCFYLEEGRLYSLFTYLVVSSLSSFFFLCGIVSVGNFEIFFILSFMVKLGLFPFVGWFYKIVAGSGWIVILLLSSVLKLPVMWVSFNLRDNCDLVFLCSFMSFLFLCFSFWVCSYSYRYVCGHMLLSSNASLLVFCFVLGGEWLFSVFFVAILWSFVVVCFFWWVEYSSLSGGKGFFLFYLVLLACPLTLSLIYKVVSSYCMLSVGGVVLVSWIMYSISEQLYLFSWILSSNSPKVIVKSFLVV